ncbi:MAG: hypothetical protein M3A44_07300 [Gammaproteobacteria bacterium]
MRTQESNRLEVDLDAVKPGITEHIVWLDKQISTVAKMIHAHIDGEPRLSKIGHALLRKVPYLLAMVTLYKAAWGRRFRERFPAPGKAPKLIIKAMTRKLTHVAFGVLMTVKNSVPALHRG